jgi:eukaryotic-like serine/threonine-protein kinase
MNSGKHIDKQLSSASGFATSLATTSSVLKRQLWLWPLVAALVLGGLGWWVRGDVEQAMRENLANELTTILNADVQALTLWTKDQEAVARSLAQSPALGPLVRKLVAVSEQPNSTASTLIQLPALADVRSLLGPALENFGYTDFFVISPSGQVVAARHDASIKFAPQGYQVEFFQTVLKGSASLSKPFRSQMLLQDAHGEVKAGLPTMFVASPIPGEGGRPLAVLALRLRPEAEFTSILQTARFGESGETYVFSEAGLLLCQSRFDNDLKRLGLLADLPDAQSILTVEVRDPQVNMMEGQRPTLSRAEQPLTRLAAKAVSEGVGVVMEPYGDYRGVPSVGACKWLPDWGVGIATEVDVADAFRPLYVLRRAIAALLGLLIISALAILFFMIIVARQRRRMEKAERTIKQLGQYTLEEKIGSGGMGSVYRARHALLRRATAVKLLNSDNVTEGGLARFEREVQLTSRLNHPNTIAVYDYGKTPEGVFYYAMEYLEGINLQELVKTCGPLPEGRVVAILTQVCGSLAEAHDIGLIHRDIKPENIVLTYRAGMPDFVKVLDFGLVKAADAEETAKLTQANVTVGTPHYLSPEAVDRPDTVTSLADIYAIGAVGYFLLTGTPVFSGKTVMEICMKHVRAIPDSPSQRLGHAVSPRLEALILRCLAKNPKDRPSSARALKEALDACEPSGDWTEAEATAWWSDFENRTGTGVGRHHAELDSSAVTIGSVTTEERSEKSKAD